jgi:hypothetical protein
VLIYFFNIDNYRLFSRIVWNPFYCYDRNALANKSLERNFLPLIEGLLDKQSEEGVNKLVNSICPSLATSPKIQEKVKRIFTLRR